MTEEELFEGYEFRRVNGEYHLFLFLKSPNGKNETEFSVELGTPVPEKQSLKTMAKDYVKKRLPNIKVAAVSIVAGATILTTIPIDEAEAHEVEFNMSYLYFGNTQSYISQVDQTQGNLSLVAPSYFDLNADGSLKITNQYDPVFVKEMHERGIKVVPFLSNHWDRNLGRAALGNREQLTTQIADFVLKNNLDGVQVDIENVTELDRANYTDLVRLLNEKLPNKEVSVAVAANPNGWTKGWHGSYDYKALGQYADYLMIMAYDESYEGSTEGSVASYGWVERSIEYALDQDVPANKIVLGVPFYGRYWKEGTTEGAGTGISNRRVDELLAKYGGKVTFDEATQSPKATVTIKKGDPTTTISGKTLGPGTYHIWFENGESIKAKLQLIHKYELKGSGSWSLGQESTSMWQNYRAWISHDGFVNLTPVVPEQPKEQTGTIAPKPTSYTVKSGDSLWKIATENGLTVAQLKEYNKLTSDVINIGQVLSLIPPAVPTQPVVENPVVGTPGAISAPAPSVVPETPKVTAPAPKPVEPKPAPKPVPTPAPTPTVKTHTVAKGESLWAISKKYGTTIDAIKKTNGLKSDSLRVGQKLTIPTQAKTVTPTVAPASAPKVVTPTPKPAPVVAPKTYPTLKSGSRGAAVTDMQNKLKKLGLYKGKIDGVYGSGSRTAIINFQKKYKLKADGVAGPATLSKLDAVAK